MKKRLRLNANPQPIDTITIDDKTYYFSDSMAISRQDRKLRKQRSWIKVDIGLSPIETVKNLVKKTNGVAKADGNIIIIDADINACETLTHAYDVWGLYEE